MGHRNWGQEQQSRWNKDYQVHNNLVDGAQRHNDNNVHHQQSKHEGLIGKSTGYDSLFLSGVGDTGADTALDGGARSNRLPWDDSQRTGWTLAWKDQPWLNDDDRFVPEYGKTSAGNSRTLDSEANSWGASHGTNDFQPAGHDQWVGQYFDSSWELGGGTGQMSALTNKLGGSNYNHYRFHETTSASNLVGSNQEDDGARLRCPPCNVVRELFWDKATKMFTIFVTEVLQVTLFANILLVLVSSKNDVFGVTSHRSELAANRPRLVTCKNIKTSS